MLRERLGRSRRAGARDRAARALRDRESQMGATGGRGLPERRRRPRPALPARRRRDRVDRRVLLLHPARPRARARRRSAKEGVAGEYWGVHGGGFYHSQKYKVAPPKLPEHLHWFKWEAYTTWLSGFALLVVLYWTDAGHAARRPSRRRPRRAGRRSALSAAGLALAWLALRRRLPRAARRPRGRGGRGRARRRLGVGGRRALRRPRRLPPGRRDARHDHGGERLLHDHPGALGARPREGGGPRAGPGAGPPRRSSARCTTTT